MALVAANAAAVRRAAAVQAPGEQCAAGCWVADTGSNHQRCPLLLLDPSTRVTLGITLDGLLSGRHRAQSPACALFLLNLTSYKYLMGYA